MQSSRAGLPLLVIVGPTAVGKTKLSIELATRLGGEIVSADSRYFYRGMDIGTAKPTPEERRGIRHHLVDVADPDETWSLALFQRAAQAAVDEIYSRDKLPILVGGTGQYIRAVTEGWQIPAQEPDHHLRDALETIAHQVGPLELHRRLARLDAQAAGRIDPNNVRRTIRALEVILRTGIRFSEQRLRQDTPYHLFVVGLHLPRAVLFKRIDDRIDAMVAGGLIPETGALLERGYSPELPALSAIGYQEMARYLRGELSLEEATRLMKSLTHRFVRRQANWFKLSDPKIHWFDMQNENVLDLVEADVRRWLAEIVTASGDDVR